MGPYMDAFGALAKILGLVLGAMGVMIVGFAFFLDVWAKKMTYDHIYCFFLEQKHLFGRLLLEENGHVFMGKGEKKEEYLLSPAKQFWTRWPPGLPKWLQVPVRTHFYVRYNPEPFDPENLTAMISATSLRLISDESMLKQTWKDVRETTGPRAVAGANTGTWVLILSFVSLLVSGITIWLLMNLRSDFSEFRRLLGG
jgi:hypothetical protein